MSGNQNIDPDLLTEENPEGLVLSNKPWIKRVNKNVVILVGGLVVGFMLFVSTGNWGKRTTGNDAGTTTSQNQAGNQSADSAAQDSGNNWYQNKPNSVVSEAARAIRKSLPSTTKPNPATALKNQLAKAKENTGKSLTTAKPVPKLSSTAAPDLSKANTTVSNEAQAEAQKLAQERQQQHMELVAAEKAGLSAQGFGKAGAGSQHIDATPGVMPASYNQPAPPVYPQGTRDPNMQDQKDKFLQDQQAGGTDYSSSVKTAPRSKFEIKAGSVIPAVMISGINSDLPGQVIAQVRENVYDSETGRYLLIPQGSRLIGLYDAHVAYGQNRVLLAWNRIIFPDGSSFDLKGMPGSDVAGLAGFTDQVDNHYAKIFGSAMMLSIISAGVQLSQPNHGSSSYTSAPSVSQTVGAALGQQIGQASMAISQKNVNIQPTLKVRPGYLFNIMVTADMILPTINRR